MKTQEVNQISFTENKSNENINNQIVSNTNKEPNSDKELNIVEETNKKTKKRKRKKKSFRSIMEEMKKGSSEEDKRKDLSNINSNLGGGEFQKKYKGWLQ